MGAFVKINSLIKMDTLSCLLEAEGKTRRRSVPKEGALAIDNMAIRTPKDKKLSKTDL
jgi:hypothetical protein